PMSVRASPPRPPPPLPFFPKKPNKPKLSQIIPNHSKCTQAPGSAKALADSAPPSSPGFFPFASIRAIRVFAQQFYRKMWTIADKLPVNRRYSLSAPPPPPGGRGQGGGALRRPSGLITHPASAHLRRHSGTRNQSTRPEEYRKMRTLSDNSPPRPISRTRQR